MGFLDNLINGFNKLVDVIFDGIGKIIEFFQIILDFLSDILAHILLWFEAIWNKLIELSNFMWETALSGFISGVPDLSSFYENFGSAMNYVSYADQWVNITLASSLLAAFATFSTSFMCVKLLLKVMPGFRK